MIVFGLKTCDTTRKALKALEPKGAEFHDLRADPVPASTLSRWLARLGPGLLNRASTTWRGLDEAERDLPVEELLALYPTLIKRPVIEEGEKLTLGWADKTRQSWEG